MLRLSLVAALGLLPTTASATDLDVLVVDADVTIDSVGQGGVAGDAEVRAVAIDSNGEIVLAGYLTGPQNHGTDAWLARYSAGGSELWSVTVNSGVIDGSTRLLSDDFFNDLVIASNGDIYATGSRAGAVGESWDSNFYLAKFDSTGSSLWTSNRVDGGSSIDQDGRGVCILPGNGHVAAAGWAWRNETLRGRWLTFTHYPANGVVSGTYDYDPNDANNPGSAFMPDQAWDIAANSQHVAVVGAVGMSGTSALDRDYDWHIRVYDSSFALAWSKDWGGFGGLEDVARAVAFDSSGDVIVAGYTNAGLDNEGQSDFDWRVAKYSGSNGSMIWDRVWDGGGGSDELLYALTIDGNDDVIVGGSANGEWRMALLSGTDGTEIDALAWPIQGAITSIAERSGQLVIAGWSGSNTRDARLLFLDLDGDGDGVGDNADLCPNDPNKVEPGDCGCNKKDIDTDGDGVLDCLDACPDLAEKWEDPGVCGCHRLDEDRDGDGTEDCIDQCPDDPNKTELGVCGCGLPDDDEDGDGVMGCDDACKDTPPNTPVDARGCPTGGSNDDTDDDPQVGGPGASGCNCSTSPSPASGLLVLAALAGVMRRRR